MLPVFLFKRFRRQRRHFAPGQYQPAGRPAISPSRFVVRLFALSCSTDPGRCHTRQQEGRCERARSGQHGSAGADRNATGDARSGVIWRSGEIRQNLSLTSETKTPAQWREGFVVRAVPGSVSV